MSWHKAFSNLAIGLVMGGSLSTMLATEDARYILVVVMGFLTFFAINSMESVKKERKK